MSGSGDSTHQGMTTASQRSSRPAFCTLSAGYFCSSPDATAVEPPRVPLDQVGRSRVVGVSSASTTGGRRTRDRDFSTPTSKEVPWRRRSDVASSSSWPVSLPRSPAWERSSMPAPANQPNPAPLQIRLLPAISLRLEERFQVVGSYFWHIVFGNDRSRLIENDAARPLGEMGLRQPSS